MNSEFASCQSQSFICLQKSIIPDFHVLFIRMYLTFLCCCSLVAESCPTLLKPRGLYPTRFLCTWDFPGKNPGVGCQFPFPGDLPDPGIKPTSLALQADSLTAEPPGKPNIPLVVSNFPVICRFCLHFEVPYPGV